MALEASALNGELAEGQPVRLVRDVTDVDKDGRLLRYVVTDTMFVNLELVMQGAARALAAPPDIACYMTFQQAEQQATTSELGLWSRSGQFTGFPTPPIKPYCQCGGADLDCHDFSSRVNAQSCYRYCIVLGYGDVFHLDNDGNGWACAP
jgi:hypothetical protein